MYYLNIYIFLIKINNVFKFSGFYLFYRKIKHKNFVYYNFVKNFLFKYLKILFFCKILFKFLKTQFNTYEHFVKNII